ncbi:MAG: 3-hydroxylacyl-ACP dehydratase [Lysobacteraceae bacterium]|nr:MAG: 3-hydroxylacyl-ACP dehydratase [Xanthomonadaceae bacterium]
MSGLDTRLSTLIWHRGPMQLMDRVVVADRDSVSCEVTITNESTFLQSPFGVPAWVGIEYMAQTAAALAGVQAQLSDDDAPLGYLLGTRKLECLMAWFQVGDHLIASAREEFVDDNGLGAYACELACNGQVVSNCRLSVFRPPAGTAAQPLHQ